MEKLAEPTFPIIFATFPTLINIPHLRLKHSLEKSRFRIGWSKKLNGVVFTIFMPFSFSAISLYETHRRRCEMGVFSQPFCQATTQAGTTVCSATVPYIRTCTCTRGCLTACAVCACVYSHDGTGYVNVCLVCWEERNVPGPWGASSRVCQPSMSRIYL